MKFFLSKINKENLLSLLNNIGVERKKWLLSVKNQDNTGFYEFKYFSVKRRLSKLSNFLCKI